MMMRPLVLMRVMVVGATMGLGWTIQAQQLTATRTKVDVSKLGQTDDGRHQQQHQR